MFIVGKYSITYIYNNKKKILSKHGNQHSLLEGASSLCPNSRGTDGITGPKTLVLWGTV